MWNARLDESQAGIKIAGRNINKLRYADNITLMAESEWGGTKEPLMRVKEETGKVRLKLNIQKTKIMASGLWQIDGEKNAKSDRLYFLGLQNHCNDCSHEIKTCLLHGRNAMTNLDSILKSRDITLLTKVRIIKAVVFTVVTYRCENWTVKKTECWKTDAFELWC